MVEPYFQSGNITLYCGDNREVLPALDVAVSAVVTDPPYGLEFMGKEWDKLVAPPRGKTAGSEHAPTLEHRDDTPHHRAGVKQPAALKRCANCGGNSSGAWNRCTCDKPDMRSRSDLAQSMQHWHQSWVDAVFPVMLPGAHLLAFGGTRTFHRLACAIEDAGLEIRDNLLYWGYGSGFPKSHNVSKVLREQGKACTCGDSAVQYNHENVSPQGVPSLRQDVAAGEPIPVNAEPDLRLSVRRDTGEPATQGQAVTAESAGDVALRDVRQDIQAAAEPCRESDNADVLPSMQWGATGESPHTAFAQGPGGLDGQKPGQLPATHDRTEQPGMEGRGDVLSQARQLQADQVRSVPAGPSANGAEGRLCDGASPNHGRDGGVLPATDRGSAPHRSRSTEQRPAQPRTLAVESGAQTSGAWPTCSRCGLPMVPEGLGTALKPSYEPIVVARKPFASTVAANVLQHGTGALNVDGCRVGTTDNLNGGAYAKNGTHRDDGWGMQRAGAGEYEQPAGRWPPNTILDPESAAMLDAMSGERVSKWGKQTRNSGKSIGKSFGGGMESPGMDRANDFTGDTGGASRFFPVLPVDDPDTLRECLVCMRTYVPKHDIMNGTQEGVSCTNANTVEPISNLTARGSDSVADHVPAPPPLASEDKSQSGNGHASNAASSSGNTNPTHTPTAEHSAWASLTESLVPRVKSAASLCDSCATATAQSLARILHGQSPASNHGLDSMPESTISILTRNLVSFAEPMVNTGIIPTTASLSILFGFVRHAINESTTTARSDTFAESVPTRFLYASKSSRAERNTGLEGMPEQRGPVMSDRCVNCGKGRMDGRRQGPCCDQPEYERTPARGNVANHHPTVKPLAVMRWLLTLVTPPGGIVLDPFAGSGTTGVAAAQLGFPCILVEQSEEYCEIAARRIEHALAKARQLEMAAD